MDAALRLSGGDALDAMHAALPFELGVDALALDDGDNFLESADAGLGERHDFDLPAMLLGEARVHAEDLGGKEGSFVATGARADFEDDVFLVVGIPGQEEDLELVLNGGFARLKRGDLFSGHGAQVGVAFGEHGAGVGKALQHLLELAVLLDGRFNFAESLGGLLVLLVVVDDLGQRELRLQLVVAVLHLFETIDHGFTPVVAGRQTFG